MMDEVPSRPSVEYIPPLPPKAKQKSTTFTQITSDDKINGFAERNEISRSSTHSLVLSSKQPSTVFIAATEPDQLENTTSPDAGNRPHVVTIRINTVADKPKDKTPKISSVHLKSDVDIDTFKINDICKKNSSFVRLNVEESRPKILENEENFKTDKPPYIYCNSYTNSMTNLVMSSGQCSPSDTLDSGTCSDLDGTPPPLPKKKSFKSEKKVSVTVLNSTRSHTNGEIDFEDNDSNISCDSLNSNELDGITHADESHNEESKKDENRKKSEPPAAPHMPSFTDEPNKDNSFLPQGLLQDIRDRSAKLAALETESETKDEVDASLNINSNANISKESAQLTSFRLVSQFNREAKRNDSTESLPANLCSKTKTPLISESTYEERKCQEKKQERMCYSSHYFDTDKYYEFHLNEKQFDEVPVKDVRVGDKSDSEVEFFAGIKDFKNEEAPSTIRSSKGTIRGVKNRVRAGIATFLQIQSTAKSYKEKDAGKVVLYTTTMGIVRSTYQRCVLVKKILRNLLVKYEERDVFMSMEYQDEIRDRMKDDNIMVPQLFVDGQHIGDADTVERLNESGDLRKMLKPYKMRRLRDEPKTRPAFESVIKAITYESDVVFYITTPCESHFIKPNRPPNGVLLVGSPDACNTCQMCGGFRLLPCRICNGSKKSLHRNHFTAEFVALKCMNCDEVGLVKCETCS